jgi:hypothetical protein
MSFDIIVNPQPPALPASEAGMKQIAFDGDFTTFDALFPGAELGPSTGITLDQAKAGLVEDGGELRVDTQLMVDAGAADDFDPVVLYLTEPAIASVNLSFVMSTDLSLPRAAVMLGVIHLDGDPLTAQAPPDVTNYGSSGGLAGVGIGFESGGFRFYQNRFQATPTSGSLGLQWFAGDVAVGPHGISTALGYRLGTSLASLDSNTTWSSQSQMGNRSKLSATYVLRPALVIQRNASNQGHLKIARFNLFYNVRS